LIYIATSGIVVIACLGWFRMMRQGQGNIVQRFRADPPLGLLLLTGLFLLFAVPSDPIWHVIYGADLSASSIPHALIVTLLIASCIAACTILYSGVPAKAWTTVIGLHRRDLLPILAYASINIITLMMLTSDWYLVQTQALAATSRIIFHRPDWMLPALILFIAAWT